MDLIAVLLASCLVIYAFFIGRNAWWLARIPCDPVPLPSLLPKVSIIIPARNEADLISRCLHAAIHQHYPVEKLEVIIVDDHSTDATPVIAGLMASRYPNLHCIHLPEGEEGKKAALTLGVWEAEGEIILQTDADCEAGPEWVSHMVAQFRGNTGMVAGPIVLTHDSDSWFQKLQALESMGLVGIAAGSIASGRANMCNGANLAYLRSAFLELGGYEGADRVASGDDELLLQKFRKSSQYRIGFAFCPETIVSTPALPDWKAFKKQRLRWVSKARAYLDKRINLIQMISYLGFLSFPILLIFAYWQPLYGWLALELFALKLIADFYLMLRTAGFFHKLPLLYYLLPLQLVYIPYVLWIGIAGNFVKSYKWKGRWVQ